MFGNYSYPLLIIIALYSVFIKELNFSSGLYSFVNAPAQVNMLFLGIIDLTKASIVFDSFGGSVPIFPGVFYA